MRERGTFEREVRALAELQMGPIGNFLFRSKLLRCFPWKNAQTGVLEVALSDPALVKGKTITVTVRYYAGTKPEVALVFAGVHGDEDEGTVIATALRNKLDAAYAAKPAKLAGFHTFLIENLRAARDVIDTKSATERFVEGFEPNRNFPLAGEGLTAVLTRRLNLGFELVDPDVRRFPDLSPRQPADFSDGKGRKGASKTILPENRILMRLIACIKPGRAVSLHAHEIQKTRGNGPGVFVDPRGGFDTDLDAPLTPDGRVDDQLAGVLLKGAVARLPGSGLSKKEQDQALFGNLPGSKDYSGETVHYAYGASKARGTSFGMWGSTAISGQGAEDRSAMQTITLEMPKWCSLKPPNTAATNKMADLWAGILMDGFLEVR